MPTYKCNRFQTPFDFLFLTGVGGALPLASLRLLASPLQLTYSYIWQIIRQRNVKQYGKVEEFVTMVTQTVPELMSFKQTAQLILGLRARVSFICRVHTANNIMYFM